MRCVRIPLLQADNLQLFGIFNALDTFVVETKRTQSRHDNSPLFRYIAYDRCIVDCWKRRSRDNGRTLLHFVTKWCMWKELAYSHGHVHH